MLCGHPSCALRVPCRVLRTHASHVPSARACPHPRPSQPLSADPRPGAAGAGGWRAAGNTHGQHCLLGGGRGVHGASQRARHPVHAHLPPLPLLQVRTVTHESGAWASWQQSTGLHRAAQERAHAALQCAGHPAHALCFLPLLGVHAALTSTPWAGCSPCGHDAACITCVTSVKGHGCHVQLVCPVYVTSGPAEALQLVQ